MGHSLHQRTRQSSEAKKERLPARAMRLLASSPECGEIAVAKWETLWPWLGKLVQNRSSRGRCLGGLPKMIRMSLPALLMETIPAIVMTSPLPEVLKNLIPTFLHATNRDWQDVLLCGYNATS